MRAGPMYHYGTEGGVGLSQVLVVCDDIVCKRDGGEGRKGGRQGRRS
jgi:hypothetical protein